MSKPPRQRPTTTAPRKAPTYNRLPAERYAQLDPQEQRRHDAHLDLDAIHDAIQYAELDRRSHGWPENTRLNDSPRHHNPETLNTVEAWSQRPDPASEWLTEYTELRAQLVRVARLARYHYGYDPENGRPEPNRPQRRNGVGTCAWCQEPAIQGRNEHGKPLVVQVDQQPIHNTTCYQRAWRAAQQAGTSIGAAIRENAKTSRHAS